MSKLKTGTKGTHKHTTAKARTGAYSQFGAKSPASDKRKKHANPHVSMSNAGSRHHKNNSTAGNSM